MLNDFSKRMLGGLLGLFVASAVCADVVRSPHLERILGYEELRVCVWPEYHSISYRDPRTYELSGVDVDLAQMLGQELGVPVTFVDSSFATLSEDLLSDQCDISMFAVGITPERQKLVRFTQPHLYSDILGITTRSNRRIKTWDDIDQPGVVVSVAKGTWHEPVMRERLRQAELLVGEGAPARELDVESGRADVFMTDFPYSQRMLQTTDWARLIVPDEPFHVMWYAWAMAPGDDPWFERVETFLADIKRDGRLREAAKRHGLDPIVVED